MCPYYSQNYKICKIYKTTQNESNKNDYCLECRYNYTDCPNFKQLSKVYNGNPPPPNYYGSY